MELTYLLAESVVRVNAVKVFVDDPYRPGGEQLDTRASTASVLLDLQGDEGNGLCQLTLKDGGERDLTVGFFGDRRLRSVSYKSVGTGTRIVSATVKVLATAVGLGLRLAGARAPGGRESHEEGEDETGARVDELQDAEERARSDWTSMNEPLAERRAGCVEVMHDAADAELESWRTALEDPGALDTALARARRLAGLAARARAEIERIDAVYAAWRAGTRTTRQETWTDTLSLAQLPGRPGAPVFVDRARQVWEELGIGVQVERLDGVRRPRAEPVEESAVVWRVPRPVRINVYRRAPGAEAALVLVSSTVAAVVDSTCDVVSLPLGHRHFGNDGLELVFGELGVPSSVGTARTSGLAAGADSLSSLPTDVLSGLETATKLQAAGTGLRDAGADRRLQGLKRRLETAQQELQLKAETATAHDFVRLKRLEQQVAVGEATDSLAPATELDELTYEANLLKVQKEIDDLSQE